MCFSAYRSSSIPSDYSYRVMVYDRVHVNKGSGYSTSTGIFTAPVGGEYFFSWHSTTYGADNYCELWIYKNGSYLVLNALADTHGKSGYDSASNSIVLSLLTGDNVLIHTGSCDFLITVYHLSDSNCNQIVRRLYLFVIWKKKLCNKNQLQDWFFDREEKKRKSQNKNLCLRSGSKQRPSLCNLESQTTPDSWQDVF